MRERYSKGVCGTLSDLIDLLKAPWAEREVDQSHDGSNYVSNRLNPKSNRTLYGASTSSYRFINNLQTGPKIYCLEVAHLKPFEAALKLSFGP